MMTAKRSPAREGKRRPLYVQTAEALAGVLAKMPDGAWLPSEPALARQLGVSRATLREAMRSFEERGMVVRRQGVGTYVSHAPRVIESGLEELESIETLAARIGLRAEMGAHSIVDRRADEIETTLFGIAKGSALWEVSRVITADGRPIAYLIDVFPRNLLPTLGEEPHFRGSVLDLLLRDGEPGPRLSRTVITAVSAPPEIARQLSIQRGDVLLCFEASLYDADGRVVDHSFSYFLPGTFRFHVLRRVGNPADPRRPQGHHP
jgi:GntR family transcriptional regulator